MARGIERVFDDNGTWMIFGETRDTADIVKCGTGEDLLVGVPKELAYKIVAYHNKAMDVVMETIKEYYGIK